MRRVRHPAHRGVGMRAGTKRVTRALIGGGLALVIVAPAPLLFEHAAAQDAGRTSGEHGAVTNWASDVATDAVSARGREPMEASRVSLEVRAGAVVVQWSLSYDVSAAVMGGPGYRNPIVRVQPMAALERNGIEIARWTLGEDQTRGDQGQRVQVRLTGTASGLFVDRTPGSGRKTYILKVWNEGVPASGTLAVAAGTRTMICEER
jgi:hypothetical protein